MNPCETDTGRVEAETPGAATPLLEARGLAKRYGSVQALADVSFTLASGEIHGLCGHNGAGKSTFVKIVTGLVRPDHGNLALEGQAMTFRTPLQAQAHGIALVDQELSLAPDLSVEENIFLGSIHMPLIRHPRRYHAKAKELLSQVGLDHVDPSTRVDALSMGERQLVEIARLLGRNARVLILDEPTASLSEAETERVFAVVRRAVEAGRGAIYISHRLDEVLDLCNQVTVFRDGRVVATRASADIAHRQELIRMMIGVELPAPTTSGAVRVDESSEVEIRGLQIPPLVDGVSLRVKAGEIVGITGQVGSGTSEVLRALGGLEPSARGVILVDGQPVRLGSPLAALEAGIAFGSNDRKSEGLFLRQSIDANLVATRLRSLSRFGILRRRLMSETSSRLVDFVQVDPSRRGSPVEVLSGGNQQKIFLGRCLDRPDVKLLVLDEPTRGVDVAGRAEIHQLVRKAALAGVAVIFGSSEIDEILGLADVVVTMFNGAAVSVRPRREATAELLSADMTMSRRRSETPA